MTHDYKRHGTTTLFAALNVLTGEVLSLNCKEQYGNINEERNRPSCRKQICFRPSPSDPKIAFEDRLNGF